MTSLLGMASPYVESISGKKKRESAMTAPHRRRTQKQRVSFPENGEVEETEESEYEGFTESNRPPNENREGFQQRQQENKSRIAKVESIIEQMNSLNQENDGSSLANFNPVPPPELQPLEELEAKMPNPPKIQSQKNDRPENPPLRNGYLANDPRLFDNLKNGSTYETSYSNVPYYAKMGNNNRHFPATDNTPSSALIEKLNYMIHLLEQQQFEKTDNIMEEFFLYLLLGGFMIYVVDSFTKTGKYIR